MFLLKLRFRLRDISEETANQQQPRRRSNSLPIPKIEVSVFQNSDGRRVDAKDFIEVPEIKDVSPVTGGYDDISLYQSIYLKL